MSIVIVTFGVVYKGGPTLLLVVFAMCLTAGKNIKTGAKYFPFCVIYTHFEQWLSLRNVYRYHGISHWIFVDQIRTDLLHVVYLFDRVSKYFVHFCLLYEKYIICHYVSSQGSHPNIHPK